MVHMVHQGGGELSFGLKIFTAGNFFWRRRRRKFFKLYAPQAKILKFRVCKGPKNTLEMHVCLFGDPGGARDPLYKAVLGPPKIDGDAPIPPPCPAPPPRGGGGTVIWPENVHRGGIFFGAAGAENSSNYMRRRRKF